MVATIGIYQAYGGTDANPASESTDLSSASTRLQTKDQFAATDTTYPIPIPASGQFNYSYWIHVYLKITGGSFTKVNNVRFYSDGAIGWNYGTGGALNRGNRDSGDKGAPMNTEYDVATGTEGTTGYEIGVVTNGHDYFNAQTTKTASVQSDTSGSPATIDSTDHTTTGMCKAVVLQVKVASDATQGEQTDETLTFKYDEI